MYKLVNGKMIELTEDEIQGKILEDQLQEELEAQLIAEEEAKALQAEIDRAYEEAKVVDPLYEKIKALELLFHQNPVT